MQRSQKWDASGLVVFWPFMFSTSTCKKDMKPHLFLHFQSEKCILHFLCIFLLDKFLITYEFQLKIKT